jgi:hypothetical protein
VASESQLSQINVSNDYKNIVNSPKMLTASAWNIGFAPSHSGECGLSPKFLFHLSSWTVCLSTHDIWFWNLQQQTWTQHISYWLIQYQGPCLRCQANWILLYCIKHSVSFITSCIKKVTVEPRFCRFWRKYIL